MLSVEHFAVCIWALPPMFLNEKDAMKVKSWERIESVKSETVEREINNVTLRHTSRQRYMLY